MPNQAKKFERAYQLARERYAELGVETDLALKKLAGIPISIHCWQGDDVGGFESVGAELGGGLAVTGNYPGKARNMIKALLLALLEPIDKLRQAESAGDYTARLALLEEARTLPMGAVWDFYCLSSGVPAAEAWIAEVQKYERNVLSKRL